MITQKMTLTFGTGDIKMSLWGSPDGYTEIHFTQVEEGKIGHAQRSEEEETSPQLVLRFNKLESIEALQYQIDAATRFLSIEGSKKTILE